MGVWYAWGGWPTLESISSWANNGSRGGMVVKYGGWVRSVAEGSWEGRAVAVDGGCYRHLGPSTFVLSPALPTVPLSMGHDNQWWRDLLGDLGPICRQQCSEHCLLRLSPLLPFPSIFFFILDLFIFSSAWLHYTLPSCHHVYAWASA